jgi:hypothetical protein
VLEHDGGEMGLGHQPHGWLRLQQLVEHHPGDEVFVASVIDA